MAGPTVLGTPSSQALLTSASIKSGQVCVFGAAARGGGRAAFRPCESHRSSERGWQGPGCGVACQDMPLAWYWGVGAGWVGGLLGASWRSWDIDWIYETQLPTGLCCARWGALSLGPSPIELGRLGGYEKLVPPQVSAPQGAAAASVPTLQVDSTPVGKGEGQAGRLKDVESYPCMARGQVWQCGGLEGAASGARAPTAASPVLAHSCSCAWQARTGHLASPGAGGQRPEEGPPQGWGATSPWIRGLRAAGVPR